MKVVVGKKRESLTGDEQISLVTVANDDTHGRKLYSPLRRLVVTPSKCLLFLYREQRLCHHYPQYSVEEPECEDYSRRSMQTRSSLDTTVVILTVVIEGTT